MFDLETSITNWRRQMAAAGIHSPTSLDELESHLREEIERQTRSGITPEQAFEFANSRVGEPRELKSEFAKARTTRGVMEKVRIGIAALLIILVTFLSVAAYLLCYNTLTDRLVLAFAVACLLAIARYWPLAIPLLPVIPQRKTRTVAALVVMLTGFGIATFVAQVILPHYVHQNENITPAILFWTVVPAALGFGLGCGLDRAGSERETMRVA